MKKSNKVLVVVDMQNDFIYGCLGGEEQKKIVPNVVNKIKKAIDEGIDIIFTIDTHFQDYLETREGSNLPIPHCIVGTQGYELIAEIEQVLNENSYVNFTKVCKGYFGSHFFSALHYGEYELIGVCTDICVVSNAFSIALHNRDAEIVIDSSCCAGSSLEAHQAALTVMKSCQMKVI